MAIIECSKCSEMIDVTASSVVLPYVCSICDEKDAAYAAYADYLADLEENGGWDDEECDCSCCENR